MSESHVPQGSMRSSPVVMDSPPEVRPTNRIALYVRSHSFDGGRAARQEVQLREEVAALNRYRRFGEIVGVFKDEGAVYRPFAKKGLQELLDRVRQRRVTLVMVAEFSDLGTGSDLFDLLHFLHYHRCGLRSLTEQLVYEDLHDYGNGRAGVETISTTASAGGSNSE